MKKTYYLFNPGRLSRKDNTLCFEPAAAEVEPGSGRRYLPVEGVNALYVFGDLDTNSALYHFLGRQHIPVHFFDYYEHYTGSFQPKEHLLAGQVTISQARHYISPKKRLLIARSLVEVAIFNMLKNLRYYQNRGKELIVQVGFLEESQIAISQVSSIEILMGLEGVARQNYYTAFEQIIPDYAWEGRKKRPPKNELNALVSFGNALCYSACLDAIYFSQLDPSVSFLHEPGFRRFSLALDIAEIFKPLLVDRLIFKLCNHRIIRDEHFDFVDEGCFLSEKGRKVFVQQWEERLQKTIKHRLLKRDLSYRHLIRLDCYKLSKFLLGMEPDYQPFKSWW